MQYYLAIDIGASSGRAILGSLNNGKIKLEEIHRFENGMVDIDGHKCWDVDHLFDEIVKGLIKCKKLKKIPCSMSIDTWAVDYALLDKNGNRVENVFGYRDFRTEGVDKKVYDIIPLKDLYARTGIQKQIFNTIYQLMAQKRAGGFDNVKTFLMLPDYLQYMLTGNMVSEYTNATSTQLVSPQTKQWDYELIEMLGYPEDIFLPLQTAGNTVGKLKKDIVEKVGFDLEVKLCASHDTASAVMSIPSLDEETLYISSGTWSLMGVENKEAKLDLDSMNANFTNEGGYEYRYRYLKNIMGLWMIQSVRHELDDQYSFAELCDMAEEYSGFKSRVDVNSDVFLSPKSMIDAIQNECAVSGQQVPLKIGEIATVIYQSLAECYAKTVNEIENNTGITYKAINIIGGGSNADYLNRLTAITTGKTVYAGPGEATAIGNIISQMISDKQFDSLSEARKCVFDSFEIKMYKGD